MTEHDCTRCGETCGVDGDWPKYFAWCEGCGDYAAGFDGDGHAGDVMADRIDAAEAAYAERVFDDEGNPVHE